MKPINSIWLKSIPVTRWWLAVAVLLLLLLSVSIWLANPPISAAQVEPTAEALVPPTSSGNLRVRCLHDPIWPGAPGTSANTVTITAAALNEALQPVIGTLQIWFQQPGSAPQLLAATCANGQCTAGPLGPFTAGTSIFYKCRLVTTVGTIESGWRQVNIGPPPATQVSPSPPYEVVRVLFNNPNNPSQSLDQNIDILFIRAQDYPLADFLGAVHLVIDQAYYREPTLLFYQNRINFWIATQTGFLLTQEQVSGPNFCAFGWLQTYTFADASALLHNRPGIDGIDCANRNFFRGFTGRSATEKDFLHETGHMPIGLADEYFNPTVNNDGYWQLEDFANLYELQSLCQAAANDNPDLAGLPGTCQSFVAGSKTWFRLDAAGAAGNDMMTGQGDHKAQPADRERIDWYLIECSVSGCPRDRIIAD